MHVAHWQHCCWVYFLVYWIWSLQLFFISPMHSMLSILSMGGKRVNNNILSSICLANVLVCIQGLIVIGGGVWIVLDYQNSMEIRQEVMEDEDETMRDYVKNAFEDFYSLFNKEGGWLNLGCVSIGIGALTLATSFFGFCGVHEKSACLLITYIFLIIIGMILQISSSVILFNRGHDMKTVSEMLNTNNDKLSSGKCYEKMIFFLLSGCFSTVVMILMIVLSIMQRQAETQGFKHLQPV